MNVKAKRITTIAMLCALAYVVMAVGRVPVVLFLKYDPKDVVITLGGLIWGPMTACLVSVLVSVLEMFTVSDTGILGCIMNILSTCAFACTASAKGSAAVSPLTTCPCCRHSSGWIASPPSPFGGFPPAPPGCPWSPQGGGRW